MGELEKRSVLKHACLTTRFDLCGREKMRGVKRDTAFNGGRQKNFSAFEDYQAVPSERYGKGTFE
jgi:hypothetical protein